MAGKHFEIQLFVVVIDIVLTALATRIKAYHKVTSVFGIFRQIKSLTMKKTTILIHAYANDLREQPRRRISAIH